MIIYMKNGLEIHLPGQLAAKDRLEYQNKNEGMIKADYNDSGLVHIQQFDKDEGYYNRVTINKEEMLFIDYENDGGGEDGEIYRPKLIINRR